MRSRLLPILGGLFFGVFPFVLAAQTVITVSVPSGSYSREQRVEIAADSDVDLYYSFAESRDSKFVKYLFPLTLSALEDEERLYTLRVEARVRNETVKKKEFTYLIDKKRPPVPEIKPPPGTYSTSLSISLLPTGSGEEPNGESTVYCVGGTIQENGREWLGEPIALSAEEGGAVTYSVKAYTIDVAGNMSDLRVWSYTIDTSEEAPSNGLQIVSPVSGSFANRQHLVIRSAGFEWVKYTIGNENPEHYGSVYTSPFLIDLAGEIKVRVAGKLSQTGEVRTAEVDFTVEGSRLDLYGIEGGVYDEAQLIQFDSHDTVYYSLDDTPAGRKALKFIEPLKIGLVENGLKYVPFRIIQESDLDEGLADFRYFFILDDRTPSEPVIRLGQKTPVREDTVVSIFGPDDSIIHFTIDGTSPDTSSMAYSGPFLLNLPGESEAGSIFVKATAFGPNGRSSTVASSLVTFDRVPPAAPEISYLGKNKTAGITIGVKGEFGSQIIFEMTVDDSLPGTPHRDSFRTDSFIDLDVPYGMERIFAFRFASIDSAGNLSPPTPAFRVLVDKVPPDPPKASFGDTGLVLRGRETLFYTLTRDGSEPKLPDGGSELYVSPVAFEFEDGKLNEIKVKTVAIDESGNTSRVSETFQFVVDRREPFLPNFIGIEDGGVYNDNRVLSFGRRDDSIKISYAVSTDGSEPPEPGVDGTAIDGELEFRGVPDTVLVYRLKLKPYLPNSSVGGDIEELRFVIDKVPPLIPVPRGFVSGATYNHSVYLLPPSGFDGEVFIDVSMDEQTRADPFAEDTRRFVNPLRLDVGEGEETTFYFAVGARDPAGNSTENPEQFSVTIDRKPPMRPVLAGIPPGGVTRDRVELSVASDFSTYFELTTDGTLPAVPTESSEEYTDALIIEGERDREILYTLRLLSFDTAGNSSRQSIARFLIDRSPPQAPEKPSVDIGGDSTVSISWSTVSENKIQYMFDDEEHETSDDYKDYTGPFTVPRQEGRDSLTLRYFSRDKAGNQSPSVSLSLRLPGRPGSSIFEGVDDDIVYNSRRQLIRSAIGGEVRYEVTTNGPMPTHVSPFSPLMPEAISFDAAPGETLRYAIRAAVFRPGDTMPLQVQIVKFTIDKTPPPPPEIPGWQDEMFFRDDFDVAMSESEGAIFISINDGSYALYTGPISLRSVSGGIDRYSISAYTKDEAGNRSVDTRQWTAYIDRQVIYVSPRGNDLFDGSRSRPFRTVSAAISEAAESERKTIYLSEGIYRISEQISVTGDLTVLGGFTESTWKKTSANNTTELLVADEFPATRAVVVVAESAALELVGLTIRAASARASHTYLLQNGGSVRIANCVFSANVAGPAPFFRQVVGSAEIVDTTFYAKSFSGTAIVEVFGERFSLRGSSIEYEDSAGDVTLLKSVGVGHLEISDSILEPGTGRRTAGLGILSSSAKLTNVRINSGEGRTKATAVSVKESSFEARGVVLVGNRSAWIATCLDASFSRVIVSESRIDALADRGAVAIQTEGTELDLTFTRIRGLQGSEFIYLLNLSNTSGLITGNMLSGNETRDFIGVTLADSTVAIVNNTLIAGEGRNVTSGIALTSSPEVLIVNNIIYATSGVAIQTDEVGGRFRILNNAFSGWDSLLESRLLSAKSLAELEYADLESLGGSIAGNLLEQRSRTFANQTDGVFRLSNESLCVDSGFNPLLLNITVREDYDGEPRRQPFDIGADEL